MIPVVTPEEMGAIDADAPEPVEELIDRAGGAVARVALAMMGGAYGRTVHVVAGKGNNGADGRVAAARLRERGVRVTVVPAAEAPDRLSPADLVVDAAYGTGFRGEWRAPDVGSTPVLAVDVPSGVDALTGEAGPGVLAADVTVTFQALKPGLLFGAGARLAGRVEVVDIGLDASRARIGLVGRDDAAAWWPHRAVDAHKWQGAVRVVAGSPGMLGAGELCAAGAARSGAGLVALSSPGTWARPRAEVIQRELPAGAFVDDLLADIERFGALVIGPGLGRADDGLVAVRRCIAEAPLPVVVDGDGIFATAWGDDSAASLLRARTWPTVLTPHDGEYGLFTGERPGPDRIAAARALADRLGVTVLLKGPTTVVADVDGEVLLVDHGDERLATAGSGDVLAGIVGRLLAAGLPPRRAAAAGAWIHAEAARLGPRDGLLAGDLPDLLPAAIGGLRRVDGRR